MQLTLGDDFIQLNMLIGGKAFEQDVPIDFDLAMPGLGLDIDGQIEIDLDYLFGFGIGFSVQEGFYLDTGGITPSGEEFVLSMTALVPDASIAAQLGFLSMEVKDISRTDPRDDGKASGMFGSLTIDLQGGGGRVSSRDMSGLGLEIRLTAAVDVDLDAKVELGGGAKFPSVTTSIHFDQTFAEAKLGTSSGASVTLGGSPRLVLKNVSLDLGTFITEFAGPILNQINEVIKPIEPIIGMLTTAIPIISDLSGEITNMLDLALQFAGVDQHGKPKFNRGLIDAIIALRKVIQAQPKDSESVIMSFGDFVIMDGSGANDMRGPNAQPESDQHQPESQLRRQQTAQQPDWHRHGVTTGIEGVEGFPQQNARLEGL